MNAKLSHLSRKFAEKVVSAFGVIEATFFILCIATILFYFGAQKITVSLALVSISLYFVVNEVGAWIMRLARK